MNRTLKKRTGGARVAALLSCLALVAAEAAWSQPPPSAPGAGVARQFPADPRVQTRTYRFEDTNEDLQYSLFVSSKLYTPYGNPTRMVRVSRRPHGTAPVKVSVTTVEMWS